MRLWRNFYSVSKSLALRNWKSKSLRSQLKLWMAAAPSTNSRIFRSSLAPLLFGAPELRGQFAVAIWIGLQEAKLAWVRANPLSSLLSAIPCYVISQFGISFLFFRDFPFRRPTASNRRTFFFILLSVLTIFFFCCLID